MFLRGFSVLVYSGNFGKRKPDFLGGQMKSSTNTPQWAVEHLGAILNPTNALRAGWVDQSSAESHYGFKRKKGLWLLKNDKPLSHSCSNFWRFVLLQVDTKMKIKSISAQVFSVFADGHSECVSHDLLEPVDIAFAMAALLKATRAVDIPNQPENIEWLDAAKTGNASVIARLIKSGVDINVSGSDGNTAMMLAILSKHDNVVEMLLTAGADPNCGRGFTPLRLAVRENRAVVVNKLLAAGANVNSISGDTYMTALMFAACPRRNRIIKILLAAKAYTFLNNNTHETAATIYKACKEGDPFDEAIYKALKD